MNVSRFTMQMAAVLARYPDMGKLDAVAGGLSTAAISSVLTVSVCLKPKFAGGDYTFYINNE